MKNLTILIVSVLFSSCINPISFWFPPDVPHQVENGRIVYYLRPGGNDNGQGDAKAPMGSLQAAFNRIRTSWRDDDLGKSFLFKVAEGTYTPGRGLVSEGFYGAFLDTVIHSDGSYIMDVEISFGWPSSFEGVTDRPIVLDGQSKVDKVLVFRHGGVEEIIDPLSPAQFDLPGGWKLTLTGLGNLTVTGAKVP